MLTKAVRLHGVNDLRLDTFELPDITDGEILASVVSDSICRSTSKAAAQGEAHKRVPEDIARNPVIVGHEFCGVIEKVGAEWRDSFSPGDKFVLQPARENSYAAPGYSYRFCGGDATRIIIPRELIAEGCLIKYSGDAYFPGSLAEPVSCILAGLRASYHTLPGHRHEMGIKPGGKAAVLAGAGPMGIGMVDCIVRSERRPSLLAVTDIDGERLSRAKRLMSPEKAAEYGVRLIYMDANDPGGSEDCLRRISDGGFDDIFVLAPVKTLVETADRLLCRDGCLNFFAGPTAPDFSAGFNFYNAHYSSTHIVGTSGGDADDMRDAISLISAGRINPASMITHICGLDAVAGATLASGQQSGKKLCYTHISLPLTAISDFERLGASDPMFAELAAIVAENGGIWCAAAESCLLGHARRI